MALRLIGIEKVVKKWAITITKLLIKDRCRLSKKQSLIYKSLKLLIKKKLYIQCSVGLKTISILLALVRGNSDSLKIVIYSIKNLIRKKQCTNQE